jgi:pimeloyl-ACP methyl ester carboxylesterase
VLDVLGVDRCVTWGVSGGGPHALACGALLTHRVAAVTSLGSVAPYDAEGLDWLAGMGEDNLTEMAADVATPLQIWQGQHDLMVPPAHGRWLIEHSKPTDVQLSEQDGHLTLLARRVPAVHEWLLGYL